LEAGTSSCHASAMAHTKQVNYLSSLLAANPTLDKLQVLLSDNCNMDVSLATLSRALRQLALSHK
jgi:hypothetical protein